MSVKGDNVTALTLLDEAIPGKLLGACSNASAVLEDEGKPVIIRRTDTVDLIKQPVRQATRII